MGISPFSLASPFTFTRHRSIYDRWFKSNRGGTARGVGWHIVYKAILYELALRPIFNFWDGLGWGSASQGRIPGPPDH